jgi:hypothetical protein
VMGNGLIVLFLRGSDRWSGDLVHLFSDVAHTPYDQRKQDEHDGNASAHLST